MESGTPVLQGRARLLELAAAGNIPTSISMPPLSAPPRPSYVTENDRQRVDELLAERRASDPEYKAPKAVSKLFKKKAEAEAFSPKEVNRAFAATVAENGPLGLVEALLDRGGDVNIARKASKNLWKKITRENQEDSRSDVLRKATQSGELEMVRLLASRADQESLDEALPYAIERGKLDIIRVLLELGADPLELHDEFLAKVTEGTEEMVELLLQGPKRPCEQCRTLGLVKAVATGSLRNVSALLMRDADGDHATAEGLQRAVRDGRNDLAIAIVAAPKPPSPASLDVAVGVAYTTPAHELEKKIELIEVCLCGGAQGDNMAETLLKAVEERQLMLIDLLLLYNASVDHKGGAVIKHAVLERQTGLLANLLKKGPSQLSLSNAIQAAMTLSDLTAAYEVTELLLNAGATGEAVAQALVTVVKYPPDIEAYKLVQLLLDRGNADVDFDNGQAIQIVVAAGTGDVLELLLTKNPAVESVNAAFTAAMSIQDGSNRQKIIEMLLHAGASGRVVDEALVTAAKEGADSISLATLLLAKASVDFENGKAICEAIRIRCFDLVQTLITGKPSPDTLVAAWVEVATLEDDEFQFKTFQTLLELGATGEPVNRSLVLAVTKGTAGLELCRLLLKHGASVDYGNGEALVSAVQRGYIETLELLLSANPSKTSLTPALAAAQAMKGDERLATVGPILKAGVAQEVCDVGLLEAVREQPSDSCLIQMFLDAKASPDFSNGESVLHVAGTLDLESLKMLAPAVHSKEVVSNAFGVVFNSGDKKWRTAEGLDFVHILIQKGATGEHLDKAAVQAAKMFDLDALELVAEPLSSKDVLHTAFVEATQTRDDWVSAEGLSVAQFLLEKGASGSGVHAALNRAAKALNFEALQLLATSVESPEVYTAALNEVLNAGDHWLLPENLDVIELLLEHGAGGEMLHLALLKALDSYVNGGALEAFVDLLLHYKADVNYDSGQAVQLAASRGDIALLQKLINSGATQESLSMAFTIAIASQGSEKQLLSLIDAFLENPTVKPDINFVYPSMDPPLQLALQLYPESVAIAKRMCDARCNLEAEVQCSVYDNETLEPETVTPLAWALFQPEKMISDDVISALIESGANVNYSTKVSKSTPLIIAAKNERSDIVIKLLKHDANPSAKDIFERTALFYAARLGDVKSIAAILKAKPGPNDGSLHEAARELHGPAIKLLIKGGHHPDFTSTRHDGRTALAELALCCDTSVPSERIETTIDALKIGKADPLKKCRDKKTALYLALENPAPFRIVEKLLERIYWEFINDPQNLYIDEDIFYSPTMYITKGFLPLDQADATRLVELLRTHNAADVYYAKEGQDQPPDAVGMPEKIAEAERKKRAREEKLRQQDEDHMRALAREAEAAGLKANIKQDEHTRKLDALSAEQTLKFSHSAAANRQRLEAQMAQKLVEAQAAKQKLLVQRESARVKAAEGEAKVKQHFAMQKTTAQGKLIAHRIKMEELEAKRLMAQQKKIKG